MRQDVAFPCAGGVVAARGRRRALPTRPSHVVCMSPHWPSVLPLPSRITVLVKHGPHVPGLRARERANPHWKSGLSSTFLEFPLPSCSRAEGPCLTRTVTCHVCTSEASRGPSSNASDSVLHVACLLFTAGCRKSRTSWWAHCAIRQGVSLTPT